MKHFAALFLCVLFFQYTFSQIYIIDTNKVYSTAIMNNLKYTITNWKKNIANIDLKNIYIISQFSIDNDITYNFVIDNISSDKSYGSFYSIPNKNLKLRTLEDAFEVRKQGDSIFSVYKKYIMNLINVHDSVLVISFDLYDNKLNQEYYINEMLIYNNKGVIFDNILYFINPIRNKNE